MRQRPTGGAPAFRSRARYDRPVGARSTRPGGPPTPKQEAGGEEQSDEIGSGPPWMPVRWTTAWPLPRAISQRLTGTATTNGDDQREGERAPEEQVPRPASIAPGMATTIALSTISMSAIESVSEARAIGMTARARGPARSSGRLVSAVAEQERQRDGEHDGAQVARTRARCRSPCRRSRRSRSRSGSAASRRSRRR